MTEPLKRLTRDDLLQTPAAPYEDYEIPKLGIVRCQGLTLGEKDDFEKWCVQSRGVRVSLNRDLYRAKLIVRCLRDQAGQRLLQDEHIGIIGAWPGELLEPVFARCQRLSGVTQADEEALVKNSESGQTD